MKYFSPGPRNTGDQKCGLCGAWISNEDMHFFKSENLWACSDCSAATAVIRIKNMTEEDYQGLLATISDKETLGSLHRVRYGVEKK